MMNERLKEIIRYKTGGAQKEFAALLGWKPPYLAKLLRGDDFGITPVRTILSAFPEIDARWLLFGTGTMLTDDGLGAVRRSVIDGVTALLELEKYMPVMSADELRRFERCVRGGEKPDFSPEELSSLAGRLTERDTELSARFAAANTKQQQRCRHPKAKK